MTPAAGKKVHSFFELYDHFLKDSRSGRRLQPNGKKVSAGTLDNYCYTKKLLQKFCAEKLFELRIRSISRLTQREIKVEKNYWAKFYKKFTDYLYTDCGHFDNYVGATVKNIRTFFGYLNKNLLLQTGDFYKQFYVRKEDVPIVTLLPEELNYLIYDKAFEESLRPQLKRVKDMFVFGCTVALRFSDLVMLKRSNIRINGSNWYICVRSKKTATDTKICLPGYAVAILQKYEKQKGGYLLPRYNKVNLNLYVKELAERAGFTHDIRKTRTRWGIQKELENKKGMGKQGHRFCDLVTTHTMRRTAITTMLSLGMPEHAVRKISGHSPMSKEFYRYVALAQSYQDKETVEMFARLKDRVLTA
ncbi:MAG: tyrosine-type recombinase/integrase [Ferruginibacter sp.]